MVTNFEILSEKRTSPSRTPQKWPLPLLWGIPNFRRLVLVCIKADFCIQIRIFQHFSRSTKFANLCTAPDSKFADSTFADFANFCKFSVILNFRKIEFCNFCWNLLFFVKILPEFRRISAIPMKLMLQFHFAKIRNIFRNFVGY